MHVVNVLKQQVVDMCLCLSAISLSTCRLNDICKEVLHYFPDLFYVVCTCSCSFMIFSKSARKSHMLPPAKLLRQNSNRLASDFRLRSAFAVISSDPLSSDVSLSLSAWNFARVSSSSIHASNTVEERSNFLTLALHLLSADCSPGPFQSTRFRYSCIRNWVVCWSPCTLGTRTQTLCSPFSVADNLSCGGRSLI